MRVHKLALTAAAVVIPALFLVFNSHTHWQTERPESLRVGAFLGDVGALSWIAKDQGYFKKVGLDVEMHGYSTGKESEDALRTGQVDIATASEFVVADRSFSEPDLRVLASVCQYWNKGLIGRRDRGIARPADLRGKRIGFTATSTAEQTLAVFLALQGLTMGDVEAINLSPKQLVEGITAGTLDAAITWQPHVAAIEHRLGVNSVSLMESGSDAYLLAITRQAVLPGKMEAIKRYLQALLLAEDWIRADPARAMKWLSIRFSLDETYVAKLWPKMRLEVALPQEILEIMDGDARWLARNRESHTLPDFSKYIDRRPLETVKPVAVTLFSQ